jgi:hypothetical protein
VDPVCTIATEALEVLMEPENRPYVDADTEAGDAGTEEWADKRPESSDPIGHKPPAKTTDDGIVDGSPADEFINDRDALGARDNEGGETV